MLQIGKRCQSGWHIREGRKSPSQRFDVRYVVAIEDINATLQTQRGVLRLLPVAFLWLFGGIIAAWPAIKLNIPGEKTPVALFMTTGNIRFRGKREVGELYQSIWDTIRLLGFL